jgi:hypothetical protein
MDRIYDERVTVYRVEDGDGNVYWVEDDTFREQFGDDINSVAQYEAIFVTDKVQF